MFTQPWCTKQQKSVSASLKRFTYRQQSCQNNSCWREKTLYYSCQVSSCHFVRNIMWLCTYTLYLPKVLGHPFFMKGLTTLVISMSTNLNVFNQELDWSAERQVLISAEHLWCDFKWAKNSSPNTNDLYIHYMDKSTGTPPSLEEKKALPNCGNKDGNIMYLKCVNPSLLQQFWSVWNDCTHMSLVFGDEFLAQGLHLKSHQKCSAGIRTIAPLVSAMRMQHIVLWIALTHFITQWYWPCMTWSICELCAFIKPS